MQITQTQFDKAMRALNEVGYSALSNEEQEICDAFDNCTLRIVDVDLEQAKALNWALDKIL